MVSSTNCIRKPKEVPNPNYFELEKPDFEPIAAISIEIWTVQKMRLQSHESLTVTRMQGQLAKDGREPPSSLKKMPEKSLSGDVILFIDEVQTLLDLVQLAKEIKDLVLIFPLFRSLHLGLGRGELQIIFDNNEFKCEPDWIKFSTILLLVQLDGVISLDQRIRVADSTPIICNERIHERDATLCTRWRSLGIPLFWGLRYATWLLTPMFSRLSMPLLQEDAMLRLDMKAIRRRPFTLLLLDETEKAHPDIFNILLRLFEDGHLTDSQVLVMEELRAYSGAELLNRMDEVVVFRGEAVKAGLMSLGIGLEVSDSIKDLVCEQGYDKTFDARPLRRAVTALIEDPLS
ncbi:hypothetical protein V6N11_019466 [Hibiscus sabdariffa]|uniref:Uncharacterized protein n=1 Tax=Hibiscus sabdariffa TaxID=183260 RepID=A0ABR2A7F6_9ROSI